MSDDNAGERSDSEDLETEHGDNGKACRIGDVVELEVCLILLQRGRMLARWS